MKKSFTSLISVLFILLILGITYFTMMPQWTTNDISTLSEFSTDRAFTQVEAIAKEPHYVGSKNHEEVARYLQARLNELGLETSVQKGYTLTDWGNLVKSKNILARIKGTSNSKAIVLLSHYDSAPHSFSKGASDAGSGVATILEGIRAFQHNKKPHKNDIIILFTDAEELGLNGAALFVTKHQWAKEVGIVLNFEARGSSGPSYMLMETNNGNSDLVKEFTAAGTTFPVTNSLMYSIYKMLPNDTDLTVFREKGNIEGYNFAFIDGHYNYHTAQDNIQNLDKSSLAHQGAYLMPLLNYFSNVNLDTTPTTQDNIYFSIPYNLINYPFSWVTPMVIIAFGLFILFIFVGLGKKLLSFTEIIKGFLPLLGAIITTFFTVFISWQLLLLFYPQYNDLLNGFTYNGHEYIAAFVALSIGISFAFYQLFSIEKLTMNHYVAPLFLWIIINATLAIYLKGAGFLIIPVFCGLLSFAYFIITQKSGYLLNLLLAIPALLLIAPLIQMLPIGLGLKILYGSAVLTVLTFALLLPIFGAFSKKGIWSLLFLLVSFVFFAKAHYYSGYEAGKAKSNSLVYLYNADTKKAHWATYDKNLDFWTKNYLGKNPKEATTINKNLLYSKYNSGFSYVAHAPLKNISKPYITFLKDSAVGDNRYLKIKIAPTRKVNRYDIFADEKMKFQNFKANGAIQLEQKGTEFNRKGRRLLSYYVVDNEPLIMEFSIPKTTVLDMELMESSFDLMQNPLFQMAKRASWMMPTPFVLTDAVVLSEKIKPTTIKVQNPENTASITKNIPQTAVLKVIDSSVQ
ncbi:hypothetical protein HNP99_000925 [Flavobacterium sp. 28A]|uniref:M28 family peptidase n=1 Tax=Flavobacterium sp. 28A TaxID=2735895 RepID=UPI001D5AB221|nr:M28 family peptidase [Flavobacterium sp. 28A]NRT14585.1 hypothetical protein [Flavobacterium sp. 28A]